MPRASRDHFCSWTRRRGHTNLGTITNLSSAYFPQANPSAILVLRALPRIALPALGHEQRRRCTVAQKRRIGGRVGAVRLDKRRLQGSQLFQCGFALHAILRGATVHRNDLRFAITPRCRSVSWSVRWSVRWSIERLVGWVAGAS